MLLYRWQGAARNFGDELNTLIWPRLLPDFFDDDPRQLFLGIGSVLDARHPAEAVKLVAGAGYGGYRKLPALDARWVIHWVRGPRTARAVGVPEELGLGDPAALLCHTGWSASRGRHIGFMPHFESAARGAWREVAAIAGLRLIDPRDEPAAVIAAIGECRTLLSEALHGVIVADTLRVPWVAMAPLVQVHHAKWDDWADTVGLRIGFQPLPASTLFEHLRANRLAARHTGRAALDRCEETLRHVMRERFVARAAMALRRAAAVPPQLSADAALARCQARMLERLAALRCPALPRAIDTAGADASALRRRHKSAYQAGSVG